MQNDEMWMQFIPHSLFDFFGLSIVSSLFIMNEINISLAENMDCSGGTAFWKTFHFKCLPIQTTTKTERMDKQSRKVIGMVLILCCCCFCCCTIWDPRPPLQSPVTRRWIPRSGTGGAGLFSLSLSVTSQSITLCIDSWLDLAFNESPYWQS